jgi:hypothetical protein
MSDSPASRPIADLPPWVRFVTFIVLFMIGTSRESVLPAFGYVDMGWPRWIFAGVMAVAVMAYIVLFNGDAFPRTFGDKSLGRIACGVVFLVAGCAAFWAIFSDLPWTNPVFWVSAGAVVFLGILEWAAKRKRANPI